MSVQKLLWLSGLSIILAACSTSNYLPANSPAWRDNHPRNIGVRYLLGRGVMQDDKQAFYYFDKAAQQGDALAQNEVAYLYAAGKGTPRNLEKSFYWYHKAAEHGLSSAQYNLGLMYLRGIGTSPNKKMAMEWFEKAAAHGFEPAKIAVGKYHG